MNAWKQLYKISFLHKNNKKLVYYASYIQIYA